HAEDGIRYFHVTGVQTCALPISTYITDIYDYQIQVQSPDASVNRGYLANAEQVRVQGMELDGSWFAKDYLRLNGTLSYTDGKYVAFANAPVPLEEVDGAQAFKDGSG